MGDIILLTASNSLKSHDQQQPNLVSSTVRRRVIPIGAAVVGATVVGAIVSGGAVVGAGVAAVVSTQTRSPIEETNDGNECKG